MRLRSSSAELNQPSAGSLSTSRVAEIPPSLTSTRCGKRNGTDFVVPTAVDVPQVIPAPEPLSQEVLWTRKRATAHGGGEPDKDLAMELVRPELLQEEGRTAENLARDHGEGWRRRDP